MELKEIDKCINFHRKEIEKAYEKYENRSWLGKLLNPISPYFLQTHRFLIENWERQKKK